MAWRGDDEYEPDIPKVPADYEHAPDARGSRHGRLHLGASKDFADSDTALRPTSQPLTPDSRQLLATEWVRG